MTTNIRQNLSTILGVSSLLKEKSPSLDKSDCSYYGRVNSTGFGFISDYEGIPENVLVNLVVSAVWIDLDSMLKKKKFCI